MTSPRFIAKPDDKEHEGDWVIFDTRAGKVAEYGYDSEKQAAENIAEHYKDEEKFYAHETECGDN